jgi:hypothetical protein
MLETGYGIVTRVTAQDFLLCAAATKDLEVPVVGANPIRILILKSLNDPWRTGHLCIRWPVRGKTMNSEK